MTAVFSGRMLCGRSAPSRMSCLAFSLVLLGLTSASGGVKTDTFKNVGLRIRRPNTYDQIPVAPNQERVLLRYVERPEKGFEFLVSYMPSVVIIDLDGSSTLEAAQEQTARYLPNHSRVKWRLGPARKTSEGDFESEVSEHPLFAEGFGGAQVGSAWIVRGEERVVAIGGVGIERYSDAHKGWRKAAEEVRFLRIDEPDLEKIAASYEKKGLRKGNYRARVRKSLLRGWKYEDTENFIVVYNAGNAAQIKKICRDIEILRTEFTRVFPPKEDMDRISTVRICHDLAEYLAYGGSLGSAGFWSSDLRELVLFATGKGLSNWTQADTRGVVYHEAFHQYVHDAIGGFEPHMWFNEGFGDYFSGAAIRNGEVAAIRTADWRLPIVKSALEEDELISWEELLTYDREQFYDDDDVSMCYAQAWSMIYFLMRAPSVEERSEWKEIIPEYFSTLQTVYEKGLAELEGRTVTNDAEELEKVMEAARAEAHQAAFGDLDLLELQAAWLEYLEDL